MLLTREQILAADDLKSEVVACPEWGGDVRVRRLTGTDRDQYEADVFAGEKRDLTNMRARLLVLAMVGEDGKPLFSAADVQALGLKSAAALDRCFKKAKELSGISGTDAAEKNSGPGPSAGSPSA